MRTPSVEQAGCCRRSLGREQTALFGGNQLGKNVHHMRSDHLGNDPVEESVETDLAIVSKGSGVRALRDKNKQGARNRLWQSQAAKESHDSLNDFKPYNVPA